MRTLIAVAKPARLPAVQAEVTRTAGAQVVGTPADAAELSVYIRTARPELVLVDLDLCSGVPGLSQGHPVCPTIVLVPDRQDPRLGKLRNLAVPLVAYAELSQRLTGEIAALRAGAAQAAPMQATPPAVPPAVQATPVESAPASPAAGPGAPAAPALPATALELPAAAPEPRHTRAAAEADERRAYLLTLHSPRGGVGTSTLAAAAALSWARRGYATLLVELTAYTTQASLFKIRQPGPGLDRILGFLERHPDGLERDDFAATLSQSVTPIPTTDGAQLALLTSAGPLRMDRMGGEQSEALLRRLAGGEYQVIVVDTGADPMPRTLAALAEADQVLVVGVPDLFFGRSLLQWAELFPALQPRGDWQLVLNRADMPNAIPMEQAFLRVQRTPLAELPDASAEALWLINQVTPQQFLERTSLGGAMAGLVDRLLGGGGGA